MSAYLVAIVDVHDPEQYAKYMEHTPRVVAQYGGRFIARGAEPLTLEGPANTVRNVVLEFDSVDDAQTFYNSPEYGRCRELRAGAATGQFFVLDGFPAEDWERALAASNQLSFD